MVHVLNKVVYGLCGRIIHKRSPNSPTAVVSIVLLYIYIRVVKDILCDIEYSTRSHALLT
jgi:hypothetical protein